MQRILVPLDGSELGEVALNPAVALARAQDAEILLVRVVSPITWTLAESEGYTPPAVYEDIEGALRDEADAYLARLATRVGAEGARVRVEVRDGTAGASLLDCEEHENPDLVVMATHGRTGLARFALGSITDLMVREGRAPVLLNRSFIPRIGALEHAVVPLDGSPAAETVLTLVETMAGKPLRSVRLLQAIEDEAERPTATQYLEGIVSRLAARGLDVSLLVEAAPPSDAIAAAAADVDLLMLSTHGRGGFDRLRHGSVADHAARHGQTPTLLVRMPRPDER